jgi:hypothetical protein
VGAVGDPVEQRLAEAGVRDDLGPLGEREVGGQDHGGFLSALGDHLEQELGADLGERDVADLVDGDQVVARPAGQDPTELELLLGLDQFVDQVGGGGEADPPLLAAGSDAEGSQQVGLDAVKRMPS